MKRKGKTYEFQKSLPKYIVWYADVDKLDLSNPWLRRWWIEQVLIYGRLEDIKQLNFKEIRENLPLLNLPPPIERLWRNLFRMNKG